MDDDDPDALEVVLKYLYSVSPGWINEQRRKLGHGELPQGYLQHLVEIFRVAEKYQVDLLSSKQRVEIVCTESVVQMDLPVLMNHAPSTTHTYFRLPSYSFFP